MEQPKLIFGNDNAKLATNPYSPIFTFSLPAGHSCPCALECLAMADPDTGRITDGPRQQFRCFAASNETRPNVRMMRWHNYTLLLQAKHREVIRDLILASLPSNAKTVRVHVSGDFYSQDYFDAWMDVADARQDKRFYAYTKSLPYWVKRIANVPRNFALNASRGGKFDHLIERFSLKSVQVVFHPDEADVLGLTIDHDDTHALEGDADFALLLHGTQPKDTAAAEAISRMRKEDIRFGYNAK